MTHVTKPVDKPWELLDRLASSIEAGNMPVLDVGGKSGEVAAELHAIAAQLRKRRTVADALRTKSDQDVLTGWLGDMGRPKLEDSDVLRFMVGRAEREHHELGFNVGWVPVEHLKWLAQVVGSNMCNAYEAGRSDMRREAHTAAKSVIELLGLKSWG